MKNILLFLIIISTGIIPAAAQQLDVRRLYSRCFPDNECNPQAFSYACRGYQILLSESLLDNPRYLSIVDFTKHSREARFFVVDMAERKLVIASTTSHGIGSDVDSICIPQQFSNRDGSHMSSLGFYITGNTYFNHRKADSLGLCLFGLDSGYNDAAAAREIVLHFGAGERSGTVYVDDTSAGRSYGCPALPLRNNSRIIQLIKAGSCLFIYSDKDKDYPSRATVLNNRISKSIIQQGPPPNNCSCDLHPKAAGNIYLRR